MNSTREASAFSHAARELRRIFVRRARGQPGQADLEQRQLVELMASIGSAAGYAEIESPHGHDGFLINLDRLADPVADFLDCRKLP